MAKNDGGSAFPHVVPLNAYGMTLRDYFAGQALFGLVVFDRTTSEVSAPHHFAKWSYALADAMLEERKEK